MHQSSRLLVRGTPTAVRLARPPGRKSVMDFDGLFKVCVATPLRGFVEVVEPEPRPRVRHVTWWGEQTVRPQSQRSGPAVRRGQGASWAAGTPHPTKVMDPARHCQEPPPPPSPSCDACQGHWRQAAVPPCSAEDENETHSAARNGRPGPRTRGHLPPGP